MNMVYKKLARVLMGGIALAALATLPAGPAGARPTAGTIVVNDSGDAATCSGSLNLRCAINAANAAPGTSIRFAPGLAAVLLQSALPPITADFTWIDGHDINGGCVCPRIDGLLMTTGKGITINASYVTISNMKIVDIPADGEDISIIGGKDIEISYDYLGILPGATQCNGLSSAVGVGVAGDTAGSAGNDNGVAYLINDTISCHGGSGVEVVSSNYVYIGTGRQGASGGNYIGATSDGAHAAGNAYAGVRAAVGSRQISIRNNLIAYNGMGVTTDGNDTDVTLNTISGNAGFGLAIGGGSNQVIVDNKIGTSADGLQPLPNARQGILVAGGSGIFLSDNLVAYNHGAGIAVVGNSTHALIQNNEIHENSGLPIDLGDDGPTANGAHFPPGPNNWLAYPVVTAYSGSLIQGTACPSCAVYLYKALGNPAAPGGGGAYVTNVLANAFGEWSANLPNNLTHLDVTMTAGDSGGNTSEMAPRPLPAPQISWSNPTDFSYGTALGNTQLNATASVSGTFVYSPPAGLVLPAGAGQSLSLVFTPTDTTNYTGTSATVLLSVNKAPLTVTADDKTKVVGSPNPTFTASYTGLVNGEGPASLGGTLVFNSTATTNSPAGTYAITPGGLSSANYTLTFVSGTLTITQQAATATPTPTPTPTPTATVIPVLSLRLSLPLVDR